MGQTLPPGYLWSLLLLPPRASIDVALALAIGALGLVVKVAPSAAPELTQPM